MQTTEIVVATIGALALVLAATVPVLLNLRRKHAPEADVQAAAVAHRETAIDRDTLIMAQKAVGQLTHVMEEQERTKKTLEDVTGELKEIRDELNVLQKSYRSLWLWVHDLRDHWPRYRLEDRPPDLPSNLHRP